MKDTRGSKELTDRQAKYIQARLSGKKKCQAVVAAGYGKTVTSHQVETPRMKAILVHEFQKRGLTPEFFADEVSWGIKHSKSEGKIVVDNDGAVSRLPDFMAHTRYISMVKDVYDPREIPQVSVNMDFGNLTLGEDSLSKLKNLFEEEIKKREKVIDVEPQRPQP